MFDGDPILLRWRGLDSTALLIGGLKVCVEFSMVAIEFDML